MNIPHWWRPIKGWKFKIVDTEFVEEGTAHNARHPDLTYQRVGLVYGILTVIGISILQTYEKRKLNVAANLVLAIKYCYTRSNWIQIPMSEIMTGLHEHIPEFLRYEKDISKYLTLL